MKLVILDRDGVINQDSPDYIRSAREWQPIEGSLEAMARLTHSGYHIVIASNQSGIGRGLFSYDDLFAMHDKLVRLLAEAGGRVDGIFFCPHAPDDGCDCRKPATGMFREIARRLQVTLTQVPVIGDSLKDVRAARAAGARPILVRTGVGRETELASDSTLVEVPVFDDLAAVASELTGVSYT